MIIKKSVVKSHLSAKTKSDSTSVVATDPKSARA